MPTYAGKGGLVISTICGWLLLTANSGTTGFTGFKIIVLSWSVVSFLLRLNAIPLLQKKARTSLRAFLRRLWKPLYK
jgi:hypothetical protein